MATELSPEEVVEKLDGRILSKLSNTAKFGRTCGVFDCVEPATYVATVGRNKVNCCKGTRCCNTAMLTAAERELGASGVRYIVGL